MLKWVCTDLLHSAEHRVRSIWSSAGCTVWQQARALSVAFSGPKATSLNHLLSWEQKQFLGGEATVTLPLCCIYCTQFQGLTLTKIEVKRLVDEMDEKECGRKNVTNCTNRYCTFASGSCHNAWCKLGPQLRSFSAFKPVVLVFQPTSELFCSTPTAPVTHHINP